ncbi:hypothetical protein [Nonomuraea sp. NPDC050310]|uniref:nucleotidyltransferase domain-containing protein n=1 Tax=Nonomuraea sp. NPDC050310 TaxID=3154935 RepID=UPI00340F2260
MPADHDLTVLDPLPAVFSAFPGPFWVAGGWAADLHAGRVLRPHADLDLLILHSDLPAFAAAFTDREILLKDHRDGTAKPWDGRLDLDPGPQSLTFTDPRIPYPLEVVLGLSDGDDWVFHRGSGRIRRPFTAITHLTPDGLRYLGPEVVLLFRSRQDRPKDHADFIALADHLTPEQAAWLLSWLTPHGHPPHPWSAPLHTIATTPQPAD